MDKNLQQPGHFWQIILLSGNLARDKFSTNKQDVPVFSIQISVIVSSCFLFEIRLLSIYPITRVLNNIENI